MSARLLGRIAAAWLLAVSCSVAVAAKTTWDMTIVWPDGNLHTRAAQEFAKRVGEATKGELAITVHAGGALGHKGPDILAAVKSGVVPIGEMSLFQQAGTEPFLSIETLPFLVNDLDELRVLHEYARPEFEKIYARHGQILLYLIPWPSQNIFAKQRADTVADLSRVKIRTQGKLITDFMAKLGMSPVQMAWGDVVPALATGRIEAVATSSPSAMDGKFWEFSKYIHRTNHLWATNALSVNRAAFEKLSEEQRSAVVRIAKEVEAKYWESSAAEDAENLATLAQHGMVMVQPSAEFTAEMQKVAKPMWDEFTGSGGSVAKEVVDAYLKRTGRE